MTYEPLAHFFPIAVHWDILAAKQAWPYEAQYSKLTPRRVIGFLIGDVARHVLRVPNL